MGQATDIEDVLSSIRRLVSTDTSAPSPGAVPNAATPPAANTATALLLEPANRVSQPEDPFQTVRSAYALEPETFEEAAGQAAEDDDGPDQIDSSPETNDAAETEASSSSETDVALPASEPIPEPDQTATGVPAVTDEAMEDLAQAERDGRDAAHVLSKVDKETEAITYDLGHPMGRNLVWPTPREQTTTPEPYLEDTDYEASEPSSGVEHSADNASAPEADTGAAETAFDAVAKAPELDAQETNMDATAGAPDVTAEEIGTAMATSEAEATGPDLTTTAAAPADGTKAQTAEEVIPSAPETAQPSAPPAESTVPPLGAESTPDSIADLADLSDPGTPETVPLDDDAFRDLIADIVRQELAGELGERITRNVRKLVRREIRQVLSSGEFD